MTERKQLEQRLLHASKLEAVGRLTGGIAHDFNNMLSVVIGNLDLLRNALPADEKVLRRVDGDRGRAALRRSHQPAPGLLAARSPSRRPWCDLRSSCPSCSS